ncbi:MAG: radical SAM protein [Treponema sp.]|nr:radical SAM protein [Treponema sp.]
MDLNYKEIKHPRLAYMPEHMLNFMQIDLCGKCNANCLKCCGRAVQDGSEIPLNKAKEILQAALDLNIKEIYLTCNAELTMYSKVIELLSWISGWTSRRYIRFDTNGLYIPDGMIETILRAKNTLFDVSMSLWGGTAEYYKECHGVDAFERVEKNIRRYINELKHFRVSSVYMKREQVESVTQFLKKLAHEYGKEFRVYNGSTMNDVEYWAEHNILSLVIRKHYGLFEDTQNPKYGKYEQKDGKVQQLQIRYHGEPMELPQCGNCHILGNRIQILPNGDIIPCMNMAGSFGVNRHVMGNVNENHVDAEWLLGLYKSERFRSWMHNNLYGMAFPQCAGCLSRMC